MRRRSRVLAIVAGLLVLAVSPALSAAAPLTTAEIYQPIGFFRFCADAQVTLANLDEDALASAEAPEDAISIGGFIYDNFNDFVSSKSYVDPAQKKISLSQHVTYRDAAKTQPQQIRCKMRTAESLDDGAWPEGAYNGNPPWNIPPYFGFGEDGEGLSTTGTDTTCAAVNQTVIDRVWASLTPEQQTASPYKPTDSTLTTIPDSAALTGAGWVEPFPTLQLNGATLEVPSKALYAPVGAAATPFFEGAHYCSSPAPDYLRAVLLGQATVS